MSEQLTESDVGKPVVHDGETVGRVVEYANGRAFVDPTPDLADAVAAKLDVGDADEKAFPLRGEHVASVTEETVRVKADL